MYCPSNYDQLAEIVEEMDVDQAQAQRILESQLHDPDDGDD
jgi:hypothetical protein